MTRAGRLRDVGAPDRALLGESETEFLANLGGPALLRVPGRDRTRARAVTTLLHGNEPSGVRALRGWLAASREPATDLVCFVGAPAAALAEPLFSHRMLPGHDDLNRCFLGPFESPQGRLAGEALAALRATACEALVDLHNNSGHNPPYAVLTRTAPECLRLAHLFAERCIHSDFRLGTLVEAMESDCPSVTIECGRSGDPAADAVARAGLARFLEADRLESLPSGPVQILESPVRVCVRPGARIVFANRPDPGADLTVVDDIDRHSFQLVPPGEGVGWVRDGAEWPIEAFGAEGKDVSRELFAQRGTRLETRHDAVPVMMTTNPEIARVDCLFYLVRPRPGSRGPEGGES